MKNEAECLRIEKEGLAAQLSRVNRELAKSKTLAAEEEERRLRDEETRRRYGDGDSDSSEGFVGDETEGPDPEIPEDDEGLRNFDTMGEVVNRLKSHQLLKD